MKPGRCEESCPYVDESSLATYLRGSTEVPEDLMVYTSPDYESEGHGYRPMTLDTERPTRKEPASSSFSNRDQVVDHLSGDCPRT